MKENIDKNDEKCRQKEEKRESERKSLNSEGFKRRRWEAEI